MTKALHLVVLSNTTNCRFPDFQTIVASVSFWPLLIMDCGTCVPARAFQARITRLAGITPKANLIFLNCKTGVLSDSPIITKESNYKYLTIINKLSVPKVQTAALTESQTTAP